MLAGASPALAQSRDSKNFAKGKSGKAIALWMEAAGKNGFSGSILAAKGGKVVAALGVGYSDRDSKRRNTPATLFEIASLSKQFTASAVLRLAEQKKLQLDDPIRKLLPELPATCDKITIRHLLQHTHGLNVRNSARGVNAKSALKLLAAGGPTRTPGSKFEYSNGGYAMLTEIIARAAEMPFTDFCRKEIFGAAGLLSTTCGAGIGHCARDFTRRRSRSSSSLLATVTTRWAGWCRRRASARGNNTAATSAASTAS